MYLKSFLRGRSAAKAGFPAVRENLENLENLEKGLFLEKARENLEKSGNFCKILQKSGNFFPESLEIDWFLANLWNPIFKIMKPTKIKTFDLFKTDGGIFKKLQHFFLNIVDFGVREKRSIFILTQGKTTLFLHFCQGKRVDF